MAFTRVAKFRKPTRTLAGVTPIAVMVKPRPCKHGTCVYCPTLNVPQSYTPASPAVMRAVMFGYDSFRQVKARIKAFQMMKHPTSKIELIIMGGTFLSYPLQYQFWFIKRCYDGLNGKTSRNLKQAKKFNETAEHRCVALCIETRPDVCSEQQIKRILDFGCTRVELGVQAIDNQIYKIVKRKHFVEDVVEATRLLKDSGFKVGYHIMPGLPGSSVRNDFEMFKILFNDGRFKPDQLKIYPCQVIKGSELEKLFKKGKYNPYHEEEIIDLIVAMLKVVPEYCRVMRIMREIPPKYLVAGTHRIDLRKLIDKKIAEKKIELKEIRSREIGFMMREGKELDRNLKLKVLKYIASNGREYFLEIVNKQNVLFALLRLRTSCKPFIKELKDSAIIRELHVYGPAVQIGKKGMIQHKGLGKWLMQEAEKISRKEGKKKIAVISGVGARQYYKKLGYELEGNYMVRYLI